jgi:hypothetical protein
MFTEVVDAVSSDVPVRPCYSRDGFDAVWQDGRILLNLASGGSEPTRYWMVIVARELAVNAENGPPEQMYQRMVQLFSDAS